MTTILRKEYRITRPDRYPEGTVGHEDPEDRQGYYVIATSLKEAVNRARLIFPEDSGFDVDLWRVLPPPCVIAS